MVQKIMKPKIEKSLRKQQPESELEAEFETPLQDDADVCQQLMSRYSASAAPQHSHLVATAVALRSILAAESLPLTSASYFAVAVHQLSDSKSLDPTAISALLSFISIVTPLVPEKGIKENNAAEAVGVLVGVVTGRKKKEEALGVASVKGVVKCLGVLLLKFCNSEDWGSVKEGFQALLTFSMDKRPKVRRSAQDCLEQVFKSFQSSNIVKEASKLVLSLFKSYMPMAHALSVDGPKKEISPKSDNLEVLHMLDLLKSTIPYLPIKISSKILSELLKLMGSPFPELTRNVVRSIEAFFETSRDEVIRPEIDNIINSLSLYVSLREKNSMDTVVSAANLLKVSLDKLEVGESRWIENACKAFDSIAGLLTCGDGTASQASDIMKELINRYIDPQRLVIHGNEASTQESEEASVVKLICTSFETALSSGNGCLNGHLLGAISILFLKLGDISHVFMKTIVLKLADFMNHADQDTPDRDHLQNCIGSAIVAMGAERILALIPISIDTTDFMCSNTWLIPILQNHVVGASLGYYLEYIVPLAKSFERASHKVKKSVIRKVLRTHAHGLWGLLPAFCRYPVDGHRKFGSLAELIINFLKKDSFMHQPIAVALQVLVNDNKRIMATENSLSESNDTAVKDSVLESSRGAPYSQKTATKNIEALASCSSVLLPALADLFIGSLYEKRMYLKDAIGCLSSITDSSITRNIFLSLLERFELVNGEGEFQKKNHCDESTEEAQGDLSLRERDAQRCSMLELASSFIVGGEEDLVNLVYNFVVHVFKEADGAGHCEAYTTLSRILKEHAWFCSSRFEELVEFLLALKSPTDAASLTSRFACLQTLMIRALEMSLDEENTKAFLILNEIILTLKDAKEETRKVAYDMLLAMSSSLRKSSHESSGETYYKFINMVMGYLSGSSPQIKSGAVAALSVLLYSDAEISLKVPDLVSSLLSLLQSKAVEVIKAVLGFTKVLVSCLQTKDLQNLLPDIMNGILPWSAVSRHHFRSKVTVILEIMIRKCGPDAVQLGTPQKYKNYLKDVLQNRHHNSTSKNAGPNNMETTATDPSSNSQEKRKRKHSEPSSRDGNDLVHPRKRRERNQMGRTSNSREPRMSTGGNEGSKGGWHTKSRKPMRGGNSGKSEGMRNTNSAREPKSDRKWKPEQRNTGNQGKASFQRPGSASKFKKPYKVGKK